MTDKVRTKTIQKGHAPFCLKSHQQCRGCYGWSNMIKAAKENPVWHQYAVKCFLTGMVVETEKNNI